MRARDLHRSWTWFARLASSTGRSTHRRCGCQRHSNLPPWSTSHPRATTGCTSRSSTATGSRGARSGRRALAAGDQGLTAAFPAVVRASRHAGGPCVLDGEGRGGVAGRATHFKACRTASRSERCLSPSRSIAVLDDDHLTRLPLEQRKRAREAGWRADRRSFSTASRDRARRGVLALACSAVSNLVSKRRDKPYTQAARCCGARPLQPPPGCQRGFTDPRVRATARPLLVGYYAAIGSSTRARSAPAHAIVLVTCGVSSTARTILFAVRC